VDGDDWISVKRNKTGTPVKVPLLDVARAILGQYADYQHPVNGHYLLAVFSNQKVNQYLKKIANRAGIKKHLTFHVTRHTLATTITLLNNVPLETVSKLLGHTKLSTTQRYARVIEQKISNDMVNLKKILDTKSDIEYNYQLTSHGHLKVVK
jgi:integrase